MASTSARQPFAAHGRAQEGVRNQESEVGLPRARLPTSAGAASPACCTGKQRAGLEVHAQRQAVSPAGGCTCVVAQIAIGHLREILLIEQVPREGANVIAA